MNMTNIMTITPEERDKIVQLQHELITMTDSVLLEHDISCVTKVIRDAIERGILNTTPFGLNPLILDLQTAIIVAREIGLSRGSVIGVMLSSCVISGSISIDEVRELFGDEVAKIMHGLIQIQLLYEKSSTIDSDNFRSLLVTMAEDMRVILITIASHVNLMRQIRDTDATEAKLRIAEEASVLYAPLAHKLGLYKLKSELEDLSLKYQESEAYYHIKDKLNETKSSREAYIQNFIKPVKEKLEKAGLKFHIKGRTKSIHSIWQKMKKQNVDVDGVYDLFAIRIILDSQPEMEKADCWHVFSIITDMYQSNPKRMRDWLSVPKSNGYESLHITVLGPEKKWVEVQIRTERMDDIAEHGLAAHWRYKGIKAGQSGIEEWLANVRAALEANDGSQLIEQLKQDLVEDEIFVFTPKGDLFKLPMGATVLDFAYHIHSNIGNRCTGARIGGKNVTIKQKLQSGDQVEILTSTNQSPKQDWLGVVITSKARNKIRQSLKEMESRQSLMAKEELERKMKNRKLDFDEPSLMQTMTRLGYKIVTEFYTAIADGRLDINNVIETYASQLRHNRGEDEPKAATTSASEFVAPEAFNIGKTLQNRANNTDVLVIDQSLKGIDFQLAKCCQPVYGDEVFGFVTSGGGFKIHRTDCPNAPQMFERFSYRILRAEWAGKGGSQYAITLRVIGNDDLGIVNNITSIISKEEKILLRSISIDSNDGLFAGTLTVMVEDTARLQQLIKKIKTVKGVKNVTRS